MTLDCLKIVHGSGEASIGGEGLSLLFMRFSFVLVEVIPFQSQCGA